MTDANQAIVDSDTEKGKDGVKFAPPGLFPPLMPRETNTRYTTWLLIRAAAGDVGARPLPGGAVFYESPDVWVESSLGINQPVPGEPNQVFARVTNLGWQYATGVHVRFWWANPSLAITETTAHAIGFGHANIPSGWSVVVACPTPWIPVEENGGHECLFAEAYIPAFDPVTAPMDPVDDRHVGQKNEQLVILKAGQHFRIEVLAANVFDFAQAVRFEIQPIHMASAHPLVVGRKLGLRTRLLPPTTPLPLSFEFSAAAPVYAGPSAVFAQRLLATTRRQIAGELLSCSAPAKIARTAHFEPWEMRTIEVSGKVPAGAEVGQTFAFRIVQSIGPIVTGGYTVKRPDRSLIVGCGDRLNAARFVLTCSMLLYAIQEGYIRKTLSCALGLIRHNTGRRGRRLLAPERSGARFHLQHHLPHLPVLPLFKGVCNNSPYSENGFPFTCHSPSVHSPIFADRITVSFERRDKTGSA